jgi:hypothetical protein
MKKLILTSFFLLLTSYFAPAAAVEAEGRAPGDMKTAREQALADALREAVRVGTGVDVWSATGVSDFTLWTWMSKPVSTTSASARKSPKPPAAEQNSTAAPKTSSRSMLTDRNPFRIPLQEPPKATRKATTNLGGRCGEGVLRIKTRTAPMEPWKQGLEISHSREFFSQGLRLCYDPLDAQAFHCFQPCRVAGVLFRGLA